MRWTAAAREVIACVHQKLPEDATLADRIAAVDAAYPFGDRDHWPYKGWLKARREYLCRFGYVPRNQRRKPLPLLGDLPRDPVSGRPVIA